MKKLLHHWPCRFIAINMRACQFNPIPTSCPVLKLLNRIWLLLHSWCKIHIMVLESLALQLLALGSHAASLFPHRRTVVKKTKIVVAVWQHIDPDSPPATQICTVKCQLYYCMCFVISWHFLCCLHCPYLFSHKHSSQICGHFCILYSLTWSIPASPEILQNLHFCAHISSCPWILYPYHCILNLILPFLCFCFQIWSHDLVSDFILLLLHGSFMIYEC
jgi:hypothetical protein